MVVPRAEKAYEKHAWIILFALGIVGVIIGLIGVLNGRPFEEPLVKSVTGMGWDELVASSPGLPHISACGSGSRLLLHCSSLSLA